MARRYFNVLKHHVFITVLLAIAIVVALVTDGTISVISSVVAGVIMITAALAFAVWLIKTPVRNIPEEGA